MVKSVRGLKNIEENAPKGDYAGFFSLQDKETAKVRFLYKTEDDIEAYWLHTVMVNGKERKVACLADEPGGCPFCKAGMKRDMKVFFILDNLDKKEIQIWERSAAYASEAASTFSRVKSDEIVGTTIEIERKGKKGDTKTRYHLFDMGHDDTTMADYSEEELPKLLGGLILEKTAEDMNHYLDTEADSGEGKFPAEKEDEERRPTGGSRRPISSRNGEKSPKEEKEEEPRNDKGSDEKPRRRREYK